MFNLMSIFRNDIQGGSNFSEFIYQKNTKLGLRLFSIVLFLENPSFEASEIKTLGSISFKFFSVKTKAWKVK